MDTDVSQFLAFAVTICERDCDHPPASAPITSTRCHAATQFLAAALFWPAQDCGMQRLSTALWAGFGAIGFHRYSVPTGFPAARVAWWHH
jgi:hypothetical protein